MIRRFCDGCSREIERNAVSDRIEGAAQASSGCAVQVTVITGVGRGVSNSGDLCLTCVVAAVQDVAFPPIQAQAEQAAQGDA